MIKVNFTIELEDDQEQLRFEQWLGQLVKITDLTVLDDTKEMYDKDTHFKKLSKKYYEAKRIRNEYINEHNYKFKKNESNR